MKTRLMVLATVLLGGVAGCPYDHCSWHPVLAFRVRGDCGPEGLLFVTQDETLNASTLGFVNVVQHLSEGGSYCGISIGRMVVDGRRSHRGRPVEDRVCRIVPDGPQTWTATCETSTATCVSRLSLQPEDNY